MAGSIFDTHLNFGDGVTPLPPLVPPVIVPPKIPQPPPPPQPGQIGLSVPPGSGKLGTSDTEEIRLKPNPIGGTSDVGKASDAFSRQNDFNTGMKQFQNFFGWNDPMMAEILKQRRERAMGLNAEEVLRMRERGSMGINQQMGTGLRALSSSLASRGVRGGAAAGAAIPVLTQANQQRAQLENDISLADMQRRSQELQGYESSLTGERAGLLGAATTNMMLGAGDRNADKTMGMWNGFLDFLKNNLGQVPGAVPDKPMPGPESFGGLPPGLGGGPTGVATGTKPIAGYDQFQKWMMENVFGPIFGGAGDVKMPSIGGGGGGSGPGGGLVASLPALPPIPAPSNPFSGWG